jgi:hypothetical protein
LTAGVKMSSNNMRSLIQNLSSLSHRGWTRGRQVRESIKVRGGRGLDNEVCDISRTAGVVAGSPIMCSGLPNMDYVNGAGTLALRSRLNSRLGMRDRY